ncbi:c-type cytochrome [Flavihumibacter profundi]|jgi:mono/diheme cytochrome c family protein|uniref:c-type cytochrome n=1 Tax=Flavihumibacter profundi TaxID=2716883 RepID=UPI001CC66AA1|nr:c-type cytochrome [Flavihumibacter profundi]MBZ5856642.1 cytochrome c [Flavihumibacter profundi]
MLRLFTARIIWPLLLILVVLLPMGINAVAGKKVSVNGQPLPKGSMERGKKVFEATCLTCHQADGSGVPRLNPPLIKSDYVTGDPVYLINILLKGLNDEIEVNGEYYGNPMPAQVQLSDQEIADVLTYVRNNFENKAKAITPAQVTAERKKLK